jgi:subtilisin family serine protease
MHGTAILGILSSKCRCSFSSICPICEILIKPIFKSEDEDLDIENGVPSVTPTVLADAIVGTIESGANIINLSLGLNRSPRSDFRDLKNAYDYAVRNNVIITVSAGNIGSIINSPILDHEWLVPVAACDENGIIAPLSNFGPNIARNGVLAPGINIFSTSSNGNYERFSGTSIATPFVTGVIALLWSIYPNAQPASIITAIRNYSSRQGIVPKLLNARKSLKILNSH